MLSKCANPECSAKFLYLHDGKVFRVDFEEHPHLLSAPPEPRPARKLLSVVGPQLLTRQGPRPPEYFWLCSACSEQMTLAAEAGSVVLLTLPPQMIRHAAAS